MKRVVLLGLLSLLVLLPFSALAEPIALEKPMLMQVSANWLKARTQPDVGSKSVDSFAKGHKVRVSAYVYTDDVHPWYKVHYGRPQKTVWLYGEFLDNGKGPAGVLTREKLADQSRASSPPQSQNSVLSQEINPEPMPPQAVKQSKAIETISRQSPPLAEAAAAALEPSAERDLPSNGGPPLALRQNIRKIFGNNPQEAQALFGPALRLKSEKIGGSDAQNRREILSFAGHRAEYTYKGLYLVEVFASGPTHVRPEMPIAEALPLLFSSTNQDGQDSTWQEGWNIFSIQNGETGILVENGIIKSLEFRLKN